MTSSDITPYSYSLLGYIDSAFFKIYNMRRYTAPGTYNCTWQVMNIASLDSGLERERESFVLFTSLLVVKCGTWTEVQVCA